MLPPIDDALLARLDVPAPRYTSYPTVPAWSESFGPAEHRAALARAAAVDGDLSLYVHVPFCESLCSFCGCNVVVSHDRARMDRYVAAIAQEATLVAGHLGRRRALARVHFGGGTPTWLNVPQLEALWRGVTDAFTIAPGAELAVEADPVVTTPQHLEALAGFGFNRISLGVQDFDPVVQQAVNRVQTVAETRAIVEQARALGFASVNLDLIYGLPGQSPEGWRETLRSVVDLRPERVAVFSFAYVPEARPNQRRLSAAIMPGGKAKHALFRQAYEALVEAGYRPVGMDHFALPGDELAEAAERRTLWRDFQGYTTRRGDDTVALGASGISSVGGAYAQALKSPGAWAQRVASGELPTERGVRLSADDQRRSGVITQLMCNFWVDLGDARAWRRELDALAPLVADGLVEVADAEPSERTTVTVTPRGRPFVRHAAMAFDAYLGGEKKVFSRAV